MRMERENERVREVTLNQFVVSGRNVVVSYLYFFSLRPLPMMVAETSQKVSTMFFRLIRMKMRKAAEIFTYVSKRRLTISPYGSPTSLSFLTSPHFIRKNSWHSQRKGCMRPFSLSKMSIRTSFSPTLIFSHSQ